MKRTLSARGYTMVEMIAMLTLMAAVTAVAVGLGRRVVTRYQLRAAVRTLSTDIARAKMKAIQTNAGATLSRDAEGMYRVPGSMRELPKRIRFDGESSDSVTFNGIGAVAEGGMRRFVLVSPYGESWEVRIYAGGGHETRRL